jgi:TatD DNase family protein
MRLIDSHAHLQSDPFDTDRAVVVAATFEASVERLLVPGWDARSSARALAMARADERIDAAVGVHPHDASTCSESDWAEVVRAVADPRVVAIGETGLDYDRMHSPRDAQLANLRRHLGLAIDTGKPAILHCRSGAGRRDAQDDLIAELRAAGFGAAPARDGFEGHSPAVLHSVSGPLDYAEAALELGLAISFSGLVFRRGEETAADVARLVPVERLLIETDSPYLAPPGVPRGSVPGFDGRRNSPPWVRVTGEWLAEQRGRSPDSMGDGLVAAYDATFRRHPRG